MALLKKTYSNLHAIHLVVRKETEAQGRISALADSDYEMAEKSGGKYFVELKDANSAEIMASDGEKVWKALPKMKKWTQIEAASDAAAPGSAPESMNVDLHTTARSMFLGRYPALAKIGVDAEFLKEDHFKLGKEKILCGVVRVKAEKVTHDLWIDEARGLVLQDVQTGKEEYRNSPVQLKITLKVKEIEVDQDVDSALFNFHPDPDWTEVEMLIAPGERQSSLAGLKAASFHGKLLDGESFELSSLRGKVVVLDFWATWCGPCMRELPSILKLRQEFAGKVEFLGINDESPGVIKGFVRKHNSDMPVLMDESREVHNQYGVNAIPTLLIIGRDGVIREHFVGTRSEEMLRSAIASAAAGTP
jgi:thiol-disulfide isomerase/thioredoxin